MPESTADLSIEAALRLMTPLVELLLRDGVTYPRFANALKKTFLEAAISLLEESSAKINDSSLSILTGIHRKDVREWRAVGQTRQPAKAFGAAMEIFTRWANDPEYCDKKGRPRVLERLGGPGSFEALAAATSSDVRSHTLLQELIRLGVARLVEAAPGAAGDRVSLCVDAFVPKEGTAEMLQLFADNVGDHIAAAAHNLKADGAPMLEQSVFADGLRPESAAMMGTLARKIWSNVFHDLVREATVLTDQDRDQPGADRRIRMGIYFYQGRNQAPPVLAP